MYNFNVREEIFGATILNLETGKRDYISNSELDNLLKFNRLPDDLGEHVSELKIKYTSLNNKQINHFSFADVCYLELTRACNLNCIHCLNNSGRKMSKQLDFEDFSNCGIQEIRFTGGEPLVYNKIYDLLAFATNKGIYTSIGTNGTLITEKIAKKLKESGLKKAIISIDGTKEAHDRIRGNGNFERTMQGIHNLESVGIEIRINSVIMKSNMDDIILLAKIMHNEKRNIMLRRFIESGRGENLSNNVLTKKDYIYVNSQLEKELLSDNYINGHYLRKNTERVSKRIVLPFDINNGCKAGMRSIIITPDGNIHLCGFLAAQNFPPIGNVQNVDNWDKFWNDIINKDCLLTLRKKLEQYNKIPNIQQTNCLAYVQNYINRGKL